MRREHPLRLALRPHCGTSPCPGVLPACVQEGRLGAAWMLQERMGSFNVIQEKEMEAAAEGGKKRTGSRHSSAHTLLLPYPRLTPVGKPPGKQWGAAQLCLFVIQPPRELHTSVA